VKRWVFLGALIGALLAGAGPAPALDIRPLDLEHRAWKPSEFALTGVPAADNPYDPDEIAVDAVFTGPAGAAVSLPAFWYQGYTRALEGEREKLTPDGPPGWRVRFTPRAAGRHGYRIVVRERGAETATLDGQLEVADRSPDAHGFVRIEPDQKRYFILEDGTPLPLVGECVCWHHGPGTFDYDAWFARLAEAGMNYARLWMWNISFGIEFLAGERLNYNQERAWRLDYVIDLAAHHGIYLMLCLDYHGVFVVEKDMWGGNNWWPKHPYNAAQGGPCATQNDFFTVEPAKQLYRKRLRYLVGRYGAQPALMAWEFFNEINIPSMYLDMDDVVAWHDDTARWLRAHDPYDRPITTSFSGSAELRAMWKDGGLDFAQYHLYLNGRQQKQSPATLIARLAKRFHRQYGTPMFVGEYGTSARGFNAENDPHFRGLHQGVWAGLLGGSAGTAMPWWWESIHGENLYSFWAALARFIEGTGFGSAAWRPAAVDGDRAALDVLGMTDGRMALVWIIDQRYAYPNGSTDAPQRLKGGRVTVDGLPDAAYRVEWWDTRDGRVLETTRARSADGRLKLEVIPFEVDVAARVIQGQTTN